MMGLLQILAASLPGMKILQAVALVVISTTAFGVDISTSAFPSLNQDLKTVASHDQNKMITCDIQGNDKSEWALLTCSFPEDLHNANLAFSVQGLNKTSTQDLVLIIQCFRLESLACTERKNHKLLHTGNVQTNATVQIPFDEALFFNYSCHVSNRDYITNPCSFYFKDIPAPEEESSQLKIIVPVMTVVGLIALLFIVAFLIRRRMAENKSKSSTTKKRDERHPLLENGYTKSFQQKEIEDLRPWVEKQYRHLSAWKKNAKDEQKTDRTLQKCLKLQQKINYRMRLLETASKELKSENNDLSEEETLKDLLTLLTEVKKTLDFMQSRQKLFIRKKVNSEIFSAVRKDTDRLQVIDNFIAVARKKADETFVSDEEDEGKTIEKHSVGLKTMTELKLLLEHYESCLQENIRRHSSQCKAEYVNKQHELRALHDTLDDFTLMHKNSLEVALQTYAFHHSSENTSVQSEQDIQSNACLPVSGPDGIKSLHLNMEANLDDEKEQDRQSNACLPVSGPDGIKSLHLNMEANLDDEKEQYKQSDVCLPLLGQNSQSIQVDTETTPDNEQEQEKQFNVCLPLTEPNSHSMQTDMETKISADQFPDIDTGLIIIPAKYTKYIHTTSTWIGSKPVGVFDDPNTSQISTRRHINDLEDVQEKLHACLSRLMKTTARSDTMIAITQTSFRLYDKQAPGEPYAAFDDSNPENILKLKTAYSDITIVNKQRGILGGIVQNVHLTDPVKVEQELADSVSKLIDAQRVIKEGINPIPKADDVAVRMTLILPNISKKQLESKLALQKAVQNVTCLYKDDMKSDKGLSDWWEASWLPRQSDTMSNNLYKNLVNRFALPAIRVHNVLSKPDHEAQPKEGDTAGDDLQTERQQSPLRPEEGKLLDFDALDEAQDDVKFLHGTDDSAMTKLLYLRALQWLSHFNARTIIQLQTTEDKTPDVPDSTNLQTAHGTFKHVDISMLHCKIPAVATVVLKEEGKETLLAALGLSPPGQSHTAIHIVADKADGDVVAAVYQWLKDQDVKTVRLWAAGKDAPLNNEDPRLPVQHIK